MNLMVIDDEPLVREMVLRQLREAKPGMERIDAAGSAREARVLMAERKYEIFLCDIEMPEEDGITFARKTLEREPDVIFIFLTAHTDFDYMKEAIALRSFDYILQPATAEELKNVVDRARQQLTIEESNRELRKLGDFYNGKELSILNHEALRYLQGESTDISYLERLLRKKGDSAECFCLFHVQILKAPESFAKEELPFRYMLVENIIGELSADICPLGAVPLLEEKELSFDVLLCFEGEEAAEEKKIMDMLENLRYMLGKVVGMETAVYYSNLAGMPELSEKYRRIRQVRENNLILAGKVFFAEESFRRRPGSEESIDERLEAWKLLLERKRLADFRESVRNHIRFSSRQEGFSRDRLRELLQRAGELILAYMLNENIKSDEIFAGDVSFVSYLYDWNSVEEAERLFDRVMERLMEKTELPNTDAVELTIRYIRQNISSDETVYMLAERVGMTPEYLTRIFKKKTGCSLKKYIEKEKMETAKALLRDTGLPVTIIADQVGYGNYSNFTRSFRQNEGMTPTEYREKQMNKGETGEHGYH